MASMSRSRRNLLLGLGFLTPNILGFLAFTTIPLVISLYMAFTNWNLTLHNMFKDGEAIRFVGLANFQRLFSQDDFPRFLGNTLFFMMGIPFSIAGSLILALLLNKDMRGKSRGVFLSVFAAGILAVATVMLIVTGAGTTAMMMLMIGIVGVLLLGGMAGGSVVYRTFFFLPSFVAGVPVYILWKKLYAPTTGPVNVALRKPLADLAQPVANAGPQFSTLAMWILLALTLVVFFFAARRLRKLWRDGDIGWVAAALGLAFIATPIVLAMRWLPQDPSGQSELVTVDGIRAIEFSDTTSDRGEPSVFECVFDAEHPFVQAVNDVLSKPLDVTEAYAAALAAGAEDHANSILQARSEEGSASELTQEEWDKFSAKARGDWIAANAASVYTTVVQRERDRLARNFTVSFDLHRTAASGKPEPAGNRMYLVFDPPHFDAGVQALHGPHLVPLPDLKGNVYARSQNQWGTMDSELIPQLAITVRPARVLKDPLTGEAFDDAQRRIDRIRLRFSVAAGNVSEAELEAAAAAGDALPANGEREAYAVTNLVVAADNQAAPLVAMDFASDANPFQPTMQTHNPRWALLIAAAIILAVVLAGCLRGQELPCRASMGGGIAAMFGAALMVVQFILIGLACMSYRMWDYSLDSFVPPEWLQHYNWAKPAIMIMGFWAAVGSNNMLMYLAGISNVPQDLYEAADIDGASRMQKFWSVTWPQLAPTTFFIVIMSVIGGLQGGFEMARTMTQGGPAGSTTTLSYFIYNEAFLTGRLGFSSAVAWTLFALVFVVTMINWRFGNRYVND